MKICPKCQIEKEFSCFSKDKNRKDGYNCYCKECNNKWFKEYRKLNSEKDKIRVNTWYAKNKEKRIKAINNYRENNIEKVRKFRAKYNRERRKTDPLFKLTFYLRSRMGGIFHKRNIIKKNKSSELLGAPYKTVMEYIEKQFTSEMNWENYGTYWNVDHKIPLAMGKTEEELKLLFHYSNLQPMICSENFKKSSNYEGKYYSKKSKTT